MDGSKQTTEKLNNQSIIWIASVRADGRPHLVPIWFTWHERKIYICIDPKSVKAKNIHHEPRVALALEDGTKPLICEGNATVLHPPYPLPVCALFKQKYDWDITTETQYTCLVQITPQKWLAW
jgi:PPOX class probable F420-dependent enzyme